MRLAYESDPFRKALKRDLLVYFVIFKCYNKHKQSCCVRYDITLFRTDMTNMGFLYCSIAELPLLNFRGLQRYCLRKPTCESGFGNNESDGTGGGFFYGFVFNNCSRMIYLHSSHTTCGGVNHEGFNGYEANAASIYYCSCFAFYYKLSKSAFVQRLGDGSWCTW